MRMPPTGQRATANTDRPRFSVGDETSPRTPGLTAGLRASGSGDASIVPLLGCDLIHGAHRALGGEAGGLLAGAFAHLAGVLGVGQHPLDGTAQARHVLVIDDDAIIPVVDEVASPARPDGDGRLAHR